MPGFAFLDAPRPLAFAHRGGAAEGDENTVAAFTRAVALGYRYVETDVHATADGVPVVFHDATLRRLTGHAGRIASLTWADLSTLRVGGAAAVPRLDEVLAAWPSIRFNVDVKSDPAASPTVTTIQRAAATDRVLLASFSDARLTRLRALAGNTIATSMGMRSVARLRLASLAGDTLARLRSASFARGTLARLRSASLARDTLARLRSASQAGVDLRLPSSVAAVQVPVRHGPAPIVDRRFLALAHRLGLQVHVWTIDDPHEMHRLLDLGVDGIMTDRIDILRDVYIARGHWPR